VERTRNSGLDWTDEETEQLTELWNRGDLPSQIALELDRNERQVLTKAKELALY
jgi:hypothetical protein